MSPPDAIFACAESVAQAAARLRFADDLPLSEVRSRGGRLLRNGPLLVSAVARALTRHGSLFPDITHVDGPALAAKQARAFAWQQLAGLLQRLSRRAMASYLSEQSEALDAALRVLRHVEGEAGLPCLTGAPDRAARLLALREARAILQRSRDQLSGGAPPEERRPALSRPLPRAAPSLRALLRASLGPGG